MTSNLKIRSLNVRGIQCKQKRNLVFTELSKYQNDIILLQETHSTVFDEKHFRTKWGPNIFFSHGESNSKGVCTIIPKNFSGKCELYHSDLEGRLLIVKISIDDTELYLFNLYFPTSNHETDQITLLMELNDHLTDNSAGNIVLGGDWNVILNDNLDKKSKSTNTCPNYKFRDNLLRLIEEHNLIDCWRLSNPTAKKFTCRSGKGNGIATLSRIDMLIISENLLNIMTNNKIEAGYMTDHNYITVTLKIVKGTRGKGTWKFNNKLLYDKTYVTYIKELIAKEIEDNSKYQDKGFLWDYIKMRIRSETMTYSGHVNKDKRDYLGQLEKNIENSNDLYMQNPTEDNYEVLRGYKNEMENINKETLAGIIFRSKCEWAEYGEKNSKYFLNLEKYNFENKHITSLDVNGKIVTEEKEVLENIRKYYENLYRGNIINQTKLEKVLTRSPRLSEEQKKLTQGLITYQECLKALKSLANGKCPGTDGITTDFYKFFWNDINGLVLDSINYAFMKGEMSQDQRQGIITLSPKKNKLRKFLKNWRPITLLTVDYKLLAKSLALRLSTILPEFIDASQFGYIKDRYIGENIRCVIDLDAYYKKEKKEIYALQIDFEKAFDSINWEFMFKSLEAMNFDKDFIKWVRILYKNTMSCVMNNGHKTNTFELQRGVHQGCPLSALLFIILVQVLQQMLDQNKDITGVNVQEREVKILQMADDTTILTSNVQDIPKILTLLKDFQDISGLKTNVDKTIAYRLGELDGNSQLDNTYDLTWRTLPISLLGITISTNTEEIIKENFLDKLQGIELLTRIWSRRNLSIKGKLTIINSILIPKLIYPSTILEVPEEVIKTMSEIIKKFFWNWKRPKVRLELLIRKVEKGGIKYPCLECKLKSWKMLWAIRALRLEEKDPLWLKIVDNLLPSGLKFTYLLKSRPTEKMLNDYCPYLPTFYKQIILNWRKVKETYKIDNKEKIRNECIWLNDKIKTKNIPLYCGPSMRKGIKYISDLLSPEGNFLDHTQLNQKFTTTWTFLDILKVRLTIPSEWKNILLSNQEENLDQDVIYNKLNNLKTLKTKDIYIFLINAEHDLTSISSSQTYWQTKYKLDENTMKLAYTLPYRSSKLTILQSLQYKILSKILNCNYWLYKIKIKDSPKCRFCEEDETIEHFFFGCEKTKDFWYFFLRWWNALGNNTPNILEEKDIILGHNLSNNKELTLNSCILTGKKMIYEQKNYKNQQPDFYKFLLDLKNVVETERHISIKNNKLDCFLDFWQNIADL
jgi:exonuclease III